MQRESVRLMLLAGCFWVFLMFLSGCETPAEPQPEARPSEVEAPEPEPEPEPAPTDEPPEPLPEPEPERDPEPADDDEEFEVTEELYDETFDEVEQVITHLNQLIADRDYEGWRELLSDEFVQVHSDPDTLRERSKSPVLQRRSVVLEDLQDYFQYVVVPSRANARLDDLRFLDDDHVEALMEVRGQEILLYQLKRDNNDWKIDYY